MEEAGDHVDQGARLLFIVDARLSVFRFHVDMGREHVPHQEDKGRKNRYALKEIHHREGIVLTHKLKAKEVWYQIIFGGTGCGGGAVQPNGQAS